jgi:hypothetical protein
MVQGLFYWLADDHQRARFAQTLLAANAWARAAFYLGCVATSRATARRPYLRRVPTTHALASAALAVRR